MKNESILLQKVLGFKVERESDKLTVSSCVSKTECIETINIVLNFDQKNWLGFVDDLILRIFYRNIFLQMIDTLFRLSILNQQTIVVENSLF